MSNKFIKGIEDKYPEEYLEGRVYIEGNVIGCLWKDPLLLDDTDIKKEMFITKDGRFLFSAVRSLKKRGLNEMDSAGVYSNMTDKEAELFDKIGGFDAVQDIMESVSLNNFDTYYDNLIRENTFCHLYDMGIDSSVEQEWQGHTLVPLEVFRRGRNEDLIAFWETKLSMLPTAASSKILEDEDVDFDEEWLASVSSGTEQGDPFDYAEFNDVEVQCYPILSEMISGLLPRTTTMLGAYSSVGKSTWWVTVYMALLTAGKKVLIISNEESVSKMKQKLMVWIAKNIFKYDRLTKRRLTSGDYSMEDKRMIEKIIQFWRDNEFDKRLKYIFINDADVTLASKKIREYHLKEGFDVVCYDTFKIQASDMENVRQDLALVRDSRTLDKLAKKYDLIMLCSVQLAEHMKGKLWLDSSCLSNSKQIKEQLENLFLMRNAFEEELDATAPKYYLRPFNRKKVNGIWIDEEVVLDPTKTYKVLFVEKSRAGANSADTNSAILMEFDGDHSIFREVCKCRPKHGVIN